MAEHLQNDAVSRLSELSLAACRDAVYWIDAGCIIYASPVAQQQTGYSAEELNGRSIDDVLRASNGSVDLLNSIKATDETVSLAGVQTCREGRETSVELRISRHQVESRHLLCLVVTERCAELAELQEAMKRISQSEARYRKIVDTSFDVMLVSQDGLLREFNSTFLKLSGYSAEEAVGMSLLDLLYPESAEIFQQTLHQDQTPAYELLGRRKDGSPIYLEVVGKTIEEDGRSVRLSAIRDISARKQFEQEILKGRNRLTLAMEGGRLGTFEWLLADGGGVVSDSFYRIFGYEPGSMPSTYKTFSRLTHPADLTRLERKFGVARLSRRAISQEARIFWPDGSMHWIEVRARFTYDATGTAVRLDGVVVDIDDKKRAELRLAKSQQHLAMALDSGNLGTYEWDVRSAVLEQSPEAEGITGRSSPGRTAAFSRWAAEVHPGDRRALLRQIGQARRRRDIFVAEFRLRRPNGSYRWVELRGRFSFDKNGKARRVTGVVGNIDHRKQAEEALRLSRFAVDVAPEAMFTLRSDGAIIDVNQTACDRLGYTREELLQLRVPDFSRPPSGSYEQHVETLRGIGCRVIRTVHRRKDGSEFDVEVSARIFSYEGHEYICATARDFSEVRSAEEKARELDRQLAHMNRLGSMGEMASAIAHELNQPLYVISNLVTLLQHPGVMHQEADEESWQMLETIKSQAILAGAIVRRMRGFCLNKPPMRTAVSIRQVITEAMSLLDPRIRHSLVQAQLQVEEDTTVLIDKVQIQQVLINLIQNAIDAVSEMPQPDRRIWIRSRQVSDFQFRIEVSDSGAGVATERAGEIFDPFVSNKDDGMGMGLAISRSIVEAHNGRLTLGQNEHHHTTFFVDLPIREHTAVIT